MRQIENDGACHMAANILLVEDEPAIQELIAVNLVRAGHQVMRANDAETALRLVREALPDLVLADWMLPGMNGVELARRLRAEERTRSVPIIMLTARSEEQDKVNGLESGADDYITKPFSPRVLLARIRVVLRRKHNASLDDPTAIKIHELVIHPGRHVVLLRGEPLDLTFTEFRLLQFLTRKPGWAFSRSQIVDAVKGEDYPVTERSVDVQVAGLRKKLGDLGVYIETVRGVGYRFKE